MEEENITILGNSALLFLTPFMLSDRGIRRSIDNGKIKVNDLTDSQIQPVSLDLRIGKVIKISQFLM